MPTTRKLRGGWLEITPDEGGDPYYWHKKDNVTSWDKPADVEPPPKERRVKPKPPPEAAEAPAPAPAEAPAPAPSAEEGEAQAAGGSGPKNRLAELKAEAARKRAATAAAESEDGGEAEGGGGGGGGGGSAPKNRLAELKAEAARKRAAAAESEESAGEAPAPAPAGGDGGAPPDAAAAAAINMMGGRQRRGSILQRGAAAMHLPHKSPGRVPMPTGPDPTVHDKLGFSAPKSAVTAQDEIMRKQKKVRSPGPPRQGLSSLQQRWIGSDTHCPCRRSSLPFSGNRHVPSVYSRRRVPLAHRSHLVVHQQKF